VLGEKIKQLQEQIDKEARKAKRARDEDAHQLAVSGN
jgi:hypothetical protein